MLSSGSEAYLQYTVIDTEVDVNFEIKITPVTCNLSNVWKIKFLIFNLCFTLIAICGPRTLEVTNLTKVLTSPNYPVAYSNNLFCIWSLQLDDYSTSIMLRFTDLDLENTKDCSSDYLELQYTQVHNVVKIRCHHKQKFWFILECAPDICK